MDDASCLRARTTKGKPMIEVALMIEGQDGLNWPRWQRLAVAAENAGFVGLYRSDHYTNANPPDKDSLELWVSLTWLASHTSRLEFGPIVSPVSFRHPSMTARIAIAVDDLSNGRLNLGLGAGWQVREHTHFGLELLEKGPRLDRFEEGVEVINSLLRSDTPVTFSGQYYHLQDAIILPRPQRPGGPPIVIGGNGPTRTLPLAAKYAGEWNGVFLSAGEYAALNTHLSELVEAHGRKPTDVRRSLMTGLMFARDDAEFKRRAMTRGIASDKTAEALATDGIVVGPPSAIVDQLGAFAEAGVQRIMLQWMDLDDIEGLEAFAAAVLPQVHA
jgi:F420-dependent oxidoreductase-like protein